MRADLSPGMQTAQAVHAAFAFSAEFPELTDRWHRLSNWLVVVAARDESHLISLAGEAIGIGLATTVVREPDLGDSVTAIALQPGTRAQRLCASLPLANRERAMA